MSLSPRAGTPIMIVEDDRDVRTSLVQVLEDEGYGVTAAVNGAEALAKLRTRGAPLPRVILLDMMMPVLDGRGFLEQQGLDPSLRDIPVLVITASTTLHEEVRHSSVHTVTLKKPFALERLISLVRAMASPPVTESVDR